MSYTCPKGHASSTDDFCDTCGAKIGGAALPPTLPDIMASPPPLPTTAPAAEPCPNCGAPRAGGSRFCEDCGYDHNTGKVPVIDPAPLAAPAPLTGWTANIVADRDYFALNAIEGVDFPADSRTLTLQLSPPQVRIGRHSSTKGTNPEIDLADFDPGVSHSHALLTQSVDGVWMVSDMGSTNGTYVNDEETPLATGQSRSLKNGDQVHVGAWTTITLHPPY